MNRQEILETLNEKFKDDIIDVFDKSPKRVYIEIKPASLVKVATYVFKDLGARFNIASGVDLLAGRADDHRRARGFDSPGPQIQRLSRPGLRDIGLIAGRGGG